MQMIKLPWSVSCFSSPSPHFSCSSLDTRGLWFYWHDSWSAVVHVTSQSQVTSVSWRHWKEKKGPFLRWKICLSIQFTSLIQILYSTNTSPPYGSLLCVIKLLRDEVEVDGVLNRNYNLMLSNVSLCVSSSGWNIFELWNTAWFLQIVHSVSSAGPE